MSERFRPLKIFSHGPEKLIPKADFNDNAKDQKNAEIRRRAAAEIPAGTNSRQRAELKAAISREVHLAMGVGVPADAELPGDDRDETAIDENTPQQPAEGGRLRIPDHLSRRYDIPQKWIRVPIDAPALQLPLPCNAARWEAIASDYKALLIQAVRNACVAWVNSDDGQQHAWRKLRPPSEAFWEADRWDRFLATVRETPPSLGDLVPDFGIQILVQPLPDPLEPGTHSVRLALENLRESDAAKELGLFGVSLSVDVAERALGPMRLERVRRSYHLAGFMTMPAIGVNGGVVNLGLAGGAHRLRSTWMPRYVLPRIQATEITDVPTAYSVLASERTEVSLLVALPDAMEKWIRWVAENTLLSEPGEEGTEADEAAQRVRFDDDLQAWRKEQARIGSGVALLARAQTAWRSSKDSSAAVPYRAWLLLNRSFAAANPEHPNKPPPGWRLFQLAFVLSHVPTFVSRLNEYSDCFDAAFDEDSASLLYMSTGGGKTEAFFGTLVYALFVDRLRGKKRGITAMMHYPLRLLTVQQAQRLARLLARAEMVRRRESVGGSQFEIGFWVGGSNTPNNTERKASQVDEPLKCVPVWSHPRARDEDALMTSDRREDREYAIAKEAWNKLPDCPFCRSEGITALRLFPEHHNQLGIVCLNNGCEWNEEHPTRTGIAPEPLPFLLVDTDIYRRAPAVLLGTIDKLALLGQNIRTVDRIAGMFGMARTVEGGVNGFLQMVDGSAADEVPADGTQHVAPSYADGVELFYDPFPSLIIQDEMHLLEEESRHVRRHL